MRKLSIILSLLIASVACFSQSIVPRTNSSFTVMDSRFKAQYNLFAPAYADTTAANLQKGVDSLGAVIFTYNTMTLWVRSQSPKVWVEVGSGGGGGNTIYTGDGTLSGDRTISLNGNSISVLNSGAEFLHIDPTPGAEHTHIQAYNTTGGGNYSGNILQVSNTTASASFASTFDAGTKQASIIAIADVSNAVINYSADVHTFTGTVVIPSPFTLGATSVTSTGTQLNYLNAATGTTGTATTNIVFSTSPLFTTPRLASTSTIGYVWMATDGSGNGSFQAIPPDNLIVKNPPGAGGDSIWYTSGDTLYIRTFNGATIEADGSVTIAGGGGMTNPMTTAGDIIVGGASGTPARLGIGTALQILRVNAGATALEWAAAAGGGDVSKVGTPVNNQLGVWTGDGTIEGDANLTFASSTLNIGVAGAATGIFTQSGVTSGTITFQPAAAAGTYTLTWPTDDGTSGQFLQTNGSGVLTWATASGTGDVTKVGTPVNSQWGIWTGDGTLKGVAVTASRAVATDANGEPVASATTATELGYVNGVTSAIQTQLDNKVFTINIFTGSVSSFTDSQDIFFLNVAATVTTTATFYSMTIDRTCTLIAATIDSRSSTAGTAEDWTAYIRVNNTTDYLIETVAVSAQRRQWNNNALNTTGIPLVAGDEIVIKMINPAWVTNPATTNFFGYLTFR